MFGNHKKSHNKRASAKVAGSDTMLQAANALLMNIDYSSVDKEIKVVSVTSAAPNEGKSTVSMALAMAAGKAGKRTLIVEGDLRRRTLGTALGLHPQHGLHETLIGKVPLNEAAAPTDFKNLDFLDAEQGIPNPEEMLASQAFAALIENMRDAYDFVVIDTSPVGAYADALMVSRVVDGTLMVIRQGSTKRREAQLAVEQLRGAGAHLLGIAMNFQDSGSGSGYYGYYSYYYEEKKVPASSVEAVGSTTSQGDD